MGNEYNRSFWTKERVDNGLQRFIRDFGTEKLPSNFNQYNEKIAADLRKSMTKRLFPPAPAVLRFYESFVAAWWKFGFLVEKVTAKTKYVMTEENEITLRKIYSYPLQIKDRPKGLPKGPKEFARQIGIPEYVGTQWAQKLGLANTKEPPWSEDELGLLDEKGYLSIAQLQKHFKQKGFKRTETAIGLMRKRRMSHKASPFYSMNAVSQLFGIDAHSVKRWINEGWLKFEMKGTARDKETQQNGDTHLIHKDWIYEFIINHPDKFDLMKVDQLWFLHIVTKGDVKLAVSDPNRISKRSECQLIEKPVEHTKLRLKRGDSNA